MARHDGVASWAELRALDLTRHEIEGGRRAGRIHRHHKGVYGLLPDLTGRGARRAALLAAGEDSALGGRSATASWGLMPWEGDIDVVAPTRRRSHRGVRVRLIDLDGHVRRRHGLRVLSVERALLDVAALEARGDVLDLLLHEAEVRGLLRLERVAVLLDAHQGERGTARLRAALRRRDPSRGRTREELERRGAAYLRRHGIPPHERGVVIPLDGELRELDCWWPRERVVLEWDGRAAHDTARAFHADRRRDRRMRTVNGIETIRATWADLDDPTLADDVRSLLVSRRRRDVA